MLAEESAAFGEESEALYRLLHPLDDGDWAVSTQFKGWTINDVMDFWGRRHRSMFAVRSTLHPAPCL